MRCCRWRSASLAETLHDDVAIASVWNALGAAFYEAALYVGCTRVLRSVHPHFRSVTQRFSHICSVRFGECCDLLPAHTRAIRKGLRKSANAIALMPAPESPAHLLARVLAEGTFIASVARIWKCQRGSGTRSAGEGICGRSEIRASRYLRGMFGGLG